MRFTPISADALTSDQLAAWRRIRNADPTLDSPFFCPEFVVAVAAERAPVEVAVIEDRGRVVGFCPYHRDHLETAEPVAGHFSDFQGLITEAGIPIDVGQLLRQCGLVAWQFNQVLASQATFQPFHWRLAESPFIDLSKGFDAYRAERRAAGTREIQETLRKSRKIQRDIGLLRLEPDTRNEQVLKTLFRWKKAQLVEQKSWDGFSAPWVLPLLTRILQTRHAEFSGMLSSLYVGDDLAAVTLGLRSKEVLHGWVTAFNRKYARFSPGRILMVKLAEAAGSLGIRRIDMGAGSEPFKRSLASGVIQLAEGAVDLRLVPRTIRHGWIRTKSLMDTTRFGESARRLVRRIRCAAASGNQPSE